MSEDDDSILTPDERERYARQLPLPSWGEGNQRRLKNSKAFIAGAGGLGSPVAMYLVAAGIGSLRICDPGWLELSNLNRQILYTTGQIGRPKVQSARRNLGGLNPGTAIYALNDEIHRKNVGRLVADADIIIDCLDNFETRYILNEYSVRTGVPLIHAGIRGMAGQLTVLIPPKTPCLRCIFPEAPPAEIVPVLGAAAGILGSLEAMEALKLLTGREKDCITNRLLIYMGETGKFESIQTAIDTSCPVCGKDSAGRIPKPATV